MSLGGVYTHLSGTAGITALVGKRVYANTLPQECSYPAITFSQISGERVITMGTVGGSGVGLPRIQVTCWAETYGGAHALADAVRITTDGFSGSFGGTTVKAVILENENDTEDYDPKGGRRYFGVIQDYMVCHTETTS